MIGHRWCEQALRTVDRADDHQLVEPLGVGELGDHRHRQVAAAEHLGEVHLGHAARGLLGVVVAVGVDHQRLSAALFTCILAMLSTSTTQLARALAF
jgi:hypothetical protein